MKNLLKILFFAVGIFFSFQTFSAELPCSKADEAVDKDFFDYCKNAASCNSKYPTTEQGSNLLKVGQIPFSPMPKGGTGSTGSDPVNIYKAYLSTLGAKVNDVQLGGVGISGGNFGIGPLEQAKYVYLETQNAIYNCAVLRAKLKITNNILKYVKSNGSSNLKTKMEAQITSLNSEIGKRSCNNAPAEKDISYKEILLKGVTNNYCNYRFYLNYLSKYPQFNVSASPVSGSIKTPGQNKIDIARMAKGISRQSDVVSKEINHSKQVYSQSFSSFAEFENTYGLHIMLLFIEDDYILLRTNLSKLLNPISQLAYKIPQAQKK